MALRPILTVVALVAVLGAGCGGDEPTTTEDPASEPASSSASQPEPEPEPEPTPAAGIGPAFLDFVRGGAVPPMWHQVSLYLGNALTGVVTPGLAADVQAWATCTEVGHYAERSCPISPLRVLKQHRRIDYSHAVTSDCLETYGPIPKPMRKLDRVVVVPAEGSVDSCIDDFAVQLFTNDEDQLVAVSTLLGAP